MQTCLNISRVLYQETFGPTKQIQNGTITIEKMQHRTSILLRRLGFQLLVISTSLPGDTTAALPEGATRGRTSQPRRQPPGPGALSFVLSLPLASAGSAAC